MSTPSPAQLRYYAEELRTLAARQRGNAQTAGPLLDKASSLANAHTWSGTYPSQVDQQVTGWKRGLADSVAAMEAEAARWSRAADDFDDRADALEKAAKKKDHAGSGG